MLQSITFKNFRCFPHLVVPELRRVNLVVGANNAGKTTLLEGIFLLYGAHNPDISLRLNAWRGIQQFASKWDEIWGWLFFEKRTDSTIELSAKENDGFQESARIRLSPPREMEVSASWPSGPPRSSKETASPESGEKVRRIIREFEFCQLVVEYKNSAGQKFTTTAAPTPEGSIRIQRSPSGPRKNALFLHTHALNFKEHAEQFSRLKVEGLQEIVVTALRCVDPRLESLDILVLGGEPVIHAHIGLDKPIPLPLLGEGFNRALAIVLGIASYADGVVLVDEVENGLHFSALPSLWNAIHKATQDANAQLIATTHSRECVLAAGTAFPPTEDSLSLIRLQQVNHQWEAIRLGAQHLDLAAELELEIRA